MAPVARESARGSHFRRKCGSLSALQRVYGQSHNLYNMFFWLRNYVTAGRGADPGSNAWE